MHIVHWSHALMPRRNVKCQFYSKNTMQKDKRSQETFQAESMKEKAIQSARKCESIACIELTLYPIICLKPSIFSRLVTAQWWITLKWHILFGNAVKIPKPQNLSIHWNMHLTFELTFKTLIRRVFLSLLAEKNIFFPIILCKILLDIFNIFFMQHKFSSIS